MKDRFNKTTLSLVFALIFAFALMAFAQGQRPQLNSDTRGQRPRVNSDTQGRPPQFDPNTHVGGKLTAINDNTLTVTNREDESKTITVTASTKYNRNREDATLSSFQIGDFIGAVGAKDANGQFVAEQIFGGDRPPQGPGGPGGRGPRGPRDGVMGEYVSVDASAGTITIKTRDGKEQVVYTTETTEISRNRSEATLSDFKAGDHVGAFGKLDATTNKYVAVRIIGGDTPLPAPPQKP
jgi:Cu/Ag efflux protein CusF